MTTRCSIEKFVDALAAQVPDGVPAAKWRIACGTKHITSAALFALVWQIKRPRPQRLG